MNNFGRNSQNLVKSGGIDWTVAIEADRKGGEKYTRDELIKELKATTKYSDNKLSDMLGISRAEMSRFNATVKMPRGAIDKAKENGYSHRALSDASIKSKGDLEFVNECIDASS